MTPAARTEAAIALLSAILESPGAPADALASAFFRTRRFIGAADRRWVSERVWEILRSRRRLSWWLKAEAPTPRLFVGASLLLCGTSFSALNALFSGSRFAPASFAPAERAGLRPLEGQSLDHPTMPEAVRLEIPDWLLAPLAARFGEALGPELLALAQPAPLDLRVNLLRATREEARAALFAEGLLATPTPFSPWGLRLSARTPITGGAAFRSGLVEIQDEGSQIVALLVGAAPGMRVADLCAGAGGKTLALAMTMRNQGRIVAADVSETRLQAAVRRLRRAGVHNAEPHFIRPGDKWAKRHLEKFDRVLVDAPCTGTGTWRRHPDARLRLRAADLAELLARQSVILDLAAPLVRKGGRLVYATCSLLVEENEAQVSAFLARNPGFAPLPATAAWPGGVPFATCLTASVPPGLLLTPLRHGTDGFFAALLERRQ